MPTVQHSIEVHIVFFLSSIIPLPQFIVENLQAIVCPMWTNQLCLQHTHTYIYIHTLLIYVCTSRLILLHPIPLKSNKITFIFLRQRAGNSPSSVTFWNAWKFLCFCVFRKKNWLALFSRCVLQHIIFSIFLKDMHINDDISTSTLFKGGKISLSPELTNPSIKP